MKDCCAQNVLTALHSQSARIADLERELATDDTAVLTANLHAALKMIASLQGILRKDGGYRTAPQQATMRAADALLVSHGKKAQTMKEWVDRG